MADRFDVIIIGGGIAGLSAGYYLALTSKKVLVLEQESAFGYHATGRAIAIFRGSNSCHSPVWSGLSQGSKSFFQAPPDVFGASSLLQQRAVMFVARHQAVEQLHALAQTLVESGVSHEVLTSPLPRTIPLTAEYSQTVVVDRDVYDIDSYRLQEGYKKSIKHQGGTLLCDTRVVGLSWSEKQWTVTTDRGVFQGAVVVNAAGAWCDDVAGLAGIPRLSIQPMRRTVIVVDSASTSVPPDSPIIMDCEQRFYIKPEQGRLLVSPADEQPSSPCDARPEELDIAITAQLLLESTGIDVPRLDNTWAGLRTFAPDRLPVIGFSQHQPGFFWLAGQGGTGIQTAPAAGRLAAALIDKQGMPEDLAGVFHECDVSPSRF